MSRTGPRESIADYQGRPHRYVSLWNDVADDWANTFELTLVDAESLRGDRQDIAASK